MSNCQTNDGLLHKPRCATPLSPFTIVAHKQGQRRTLQLLAKDKASAILSAQELLPGWLLSVPSLSPQW